MGLPGTEVRTAGARQSTWRSRCANQAPRERSVWRKAGTPGQSLCPVIGCSPAAERWADSPPRGVSTRREASRARRCARWQPDPAEPLLIKAIVLESTAQVRRLTAGRRRSESVPGLLRGSEERRGSHRALWNSTSTERQAPAHRCHQVNFTLGAESFDPEEWFAQNLRPCLQQARVRRER